MKAAGFVEIGTELREPRLRRDGTGDGNSRRQGRRSRRPARRRREVLAHDGPAVLDVVTATQELSMPPTIDARAGQGIQPVAAPRRHERRGDEVIDLAKTNLLPR